MKQFFLTSLTLSISLLTCLSSNSLAQVFQGATTPENIYPPAANPVGDVVSISCAEETGYGQTPSTRNTLCIYTIKAWDGGLTGQSGIAWQCHDASTGTLYDQGIMLYPPGIHGIDVTMKRHANYDFDYLPYIVVAYYNEEGAISWQGQTLQKGHYYDTYYFTWGGLTHKLTQNVSTLSNYTKIDVESRPSSFAMLWEDPALGLMLKGGEWDAFQLTPFGNTIQILGTFGAHNPDIAIGGAWFESCLHIIYYKMVGATPQIEESKLDWNAVVYGPPITTITQTVNDINVLPPTGGVMPDVHADLAVAIANDQFSDWWTYVYTDYTNNTIYARMSDPYTNPTPYTVAINDGTLAGGTIPAINSFTNDYPAVRYMDESVNWSFTDLYIGWYTGYDNSSASSHGFGPEGCYVGIKMNTDGTILSPLDYLIIPTSLSNIPAATPRLCFDKGYTYSKYTIYTQEDFWGNKIINEKMPPMGNGVFKPASVTTHANDQDVGILIFPNPATDIINISSSQNINNGEYRIYNSLGQLTSNGKLNEMQVDIAGLTPGKYYIHVVKDDMIIANQNFTKQ